MRTASLGSTGLAAVVLAAGAPSTLAAPATADLDGARDLIRQAVREAGASGAGLAPALLAREGTSGLRLRSFARGDTAIVIAADRTGSFVAFRVVEGAVSQGSTVSRPEAAFPRYLDSAWDLSRDGCGVFALAFGVLGAGDPSEVHVVFETPSGPPERVVLHGSRPTVDAAQLDAVTLIRPQASFSPVLQPMATADPCVTFEERYRVTCRRVALVRVAPEDTAIAALTRYFEELAGLAPKDPGITVRGGPGVARIDPRHPASYRSEGDGVFRLFLNGEERTVRARRDEPGNWQLTFEPGAP